MHLYMYIISSCPQTIREFLHILTLFLYLSLFFQIKLLQLHVKCLTLTFRFNSMFPWCTILLCSSSVKSCSFFLCLIYCKAHWLFIGFSQNVHRKSDLLHEKSKIKFHHCTAMPKWHIVIVHALLLWSTCQFVFHDVSAISFSVFVYKRRKRRLAINPFFCFELISFPKL